MCNRADENRKKLLAKEKADKEQKAKEYKLWLEERKAKLASDQSEAVKLPSTQSRTPDISAIAAKMEERRLRWMQECVPWRSVVEDASAA